MKHYSVRVYGLVQGVYFRASAKQKADEMGISGFTRNEKDGSVYIEAEGNEDVLKFFFDWCHTGPSRAAVAKVIIREGDLKNFARFEVRR